MSIDTPDDLNVRRTIAMRARTFALSAPNVTMTPLGSPVLPDVYCKNARSVEVMGFSSMISINALVVVDRNDFFAG